MSDMPVVSPANLQEVREDVREECEKFGPVRKIMVFDVRVLGSVEAVSTAQHSLHNALCSGGRLTILARQPLPCVAIIVQ